MSQNPRITLPRRLLLAGIGLVLGAVAAQAGSLDAPAAPSAAGSALHTLEDVYNRIDDGTAGTKRAGAFTEPTAAPAATGHDLDDLYDLASQRSRPAKTGQTTTVPLNPAPAGSDGALQKGVTWPNPRFTDNTNGTVTDNLTGLIWLKNANCTEAVGGVNKESGYLSWSDALTWSNALASGACDLSDGSTAGDWRLPNIKELKSLVHFGYYEPALSNTAGTGQWSDRNPFSGVQSKKYVWSSTSHANQASPAAWILYTFDGTVSVLNKVNTLVVWPVRGGQ